MARDTPFDTLGAPYADELAKIRARLALAQALTQTYGRAPQVQMVGQHYVKPAWTQHLAQLTNALSGAKAQADSASQMADLQQRYQKDQSGAVGEMQQLATGGPRELAGPPQEGEQMGTAMVPGNPLAAEQYGQTSQYPQAQALAKKHGRVMQVSMPGLESIGIDVFEEGNHMFDYSYETIEECLNDLNRITWTFFSPKDRWTEDQVIRYTENWYAKSLHTFAIEAVPIHTEYSYLHHPELIRLSPLSAIFKLLAATIPKEYGSLDEAIELANDLNGELGLPVITVEGILGGNKVEAQAMLSRIVVEIDMNLDVLDFVDGIVFSDRNIANSAYNRAFDDAASQIYQGLWVDLARKG